MAVINNTKGLTPAVRIAARTLVWSLRKRLSRRGYRTSIGDPYREPGRDSGELWPNRYAEESAARWPEAGPEIHLNPVLSGVPLATVLASSSTVRRPSRASSLDDFLNRSVYDPELFRDYLTAEECSIIHAMEELADAVHAQAAASDEMVSVIMPTRNRWDEQFHRAVFSVLNQTHQNLELLILDHGGHLVGADIPILQDPRVTLRDVSHLDGLGAVRQWGLDNARGSFIAWLDDDDLWDLGNLRISIDQIVSRDLVAFYSAVLVVDGPVGPSGLGSNFSCIRWTPFRRSLLHNRNVIGSFSLVHRRLPPGQLTIPVDRYTDWATACQLADHGTVASLPIVLSVYNDQSRRGAVSNRHTAEAALASFRQWQKDHYGATVDLAGVLEPRYPLPAPSVSIDRDIAVVIVSRDSTDNMSELISSLSPSLLSCPGASMLVVNASGDAAWGVDIQRIIRESGHPGTVVETSHREYSDALAEAIHRCPETTWAVVTLPAEARVTNGEFHHLLVPLLDNPEISQVVPSHLVSAHSAEFKPDWTRCHRDALIDVTFSPRHHNARVGDRLDPEGSLVIEHNPWPVSAFRIHDSVSTAINSDNGGFPGKIVYGPGFCVRID